VSLRRVIHAQVVADLSYHDFARVEADSHREAHPAIEAQLVAVAAKGFEQVQRCVAGPLGVILVRDRSPEERHATRREWQREAQSADRKGEAILADLTVCIKDAYSCR
jgi:hypothetical protein